MKLEPISPELRTVTTAGDRNYIWGVFLLLASMHRWQMPEKVLVGTYGWPSQWIEFLEKWPNVRTVEPPAGRQCVCVTKPWLMLRAETDYVTWVDSDGIFLGNCSDFLYGEPEALYSRAYNPAELATHHFARLDGTVAAWVRDVGDLPARRDIPDICTNVVGVSRRHNTHLLERWIEQMQRVLPADVGVVAAKNSPYFQTDESVLNSLLSCWGPAPPITACYRMNNPRTAYYGHLAYNPKPWQQFWTPFALRYYNAVLELIEWCADNDLLPPFEPLPPTLLRRNEAFYRRCAPFAPYWFRVRKKLRKWGLLK